MDSPSTPHIQFPPSLDAALAAWESNVLRDLKGADFAKRLITQTPEGVDIAPLYTEKDLPEGESGVPGRAPFTRGSKANPGPWELSQRYDRQDPSEMNNALMTDLEGGISAPVLSIQGGLLGSGGLKALLAATEGVDLSMIHLGIEAGARGAAAGALMLALYDKKGVLPEARRGNLGLDPIGALAATGDGVAEDLLSGVTAFGRYLGPESPHLAIAKVHLAPYARAGADRTQLLGIALSTGVAYLRALVRGGLDINLALKRLAFTFPLGTHIFRDIAMLRAARGLWDRVAEASGASPERPGMDIWGETDLSLLTQRDPWVNILRGTAGVVSGALGGANGILCAPFDTTLGHASPQSRRLARNTQLVLMAESGLARVQDAMGGSYLIESLTHQYEEAAWAYFQHLEAGGGIDRMLRSGALHHELAPKADERAARVRTRKRPITGVSEFPNLGEALPTPTPRASHPLEGETPLTQRDAEALARATGPEALQAAIDAALNGASLNPIGDHLSGPIRRICDPLPHHRLAQAFESLRDASDAHLARSGARPALFIATLGKAAHYTQRAIWIENLLAAGGIEGHTPGDLHDGDTAAEAFRGSGASGAILCGADSAYGGLGLEVLSALKAAGASPLLVAGRPPKDPDAKAALTSAGAEGFVHLGQDVITLLEGLLAAQGALHVDS